MTTNHLSHNSYMVKKKHLGWLSRLKDWFLAIDTQWGGGVMGEGVLIVAMNQ